MVGNRKEGTGFGARSTAEEVTEGVDGTGLTAIVTGSTNGIGKETVRVFAKRGVHVFMAVRNLELAGTVKEEILKETPDAKVDLLKLDTSSFESVRKAADEFLALNLPLNILVCNAGISIVPFELTKDGIEKQFETNYLGHFLLTNLLLEKLKTTATESGIEGKIINVSSEGLYFFEYKNEGIRFEKLNDKNGYSQYAAYGQSKLAQYLSTTELSRQLQEGGVNVTVNVVHPGSVKTNIFNNHNLFVRGIVKVLLSVLPGVKTVDQGAATQVYLALNPQAAGVTGKYYSDVNEFETPSKFAKDPDLAKKLLEFSTQLTTPS